MDPFFFGSRDDSPHTPRTAPADPAGTDRAHCMPLPHPGTFAPGDQVTHHGHVAIRGRKTWWWTNDTWLGRHLLNRWSDELMDEFLSCEHPYARITYLNPDRSDR